MIVCLFFLQHFLDNYDPGEFLDCLPDDIPSQDLLSILD